MDTNANQHTVVATTLGELTLTSSAGRIAGLYFPDHWHPPREEALGNRVDNGFDDAIVQLSEYLAGERRDFDLEVEIRGNSFERSVWQLISQIPYGETRTYGDLANLLGPAISPRVVGGAVARNPLSIFIPCHRVVGSNGKLIGYAGGLERKSALLALESEVTDPPRTLF